MSEPRLILLNGPPGIGKSTLARIYVQQHPLAFCLDIDGIRRLIGRWDSHPHESGLLAREMARAMMAAHLGGGHDVIVPQFVAETAFIKQLKELTPGFIEVFLWAERSAALARFHARAGDVRWSVHHAEAARLIHGDSGFLDMYDRLEPRTRGATLIQSVAGAEQPTYDALMRIIRERDEPGDR